MQPAALSLILPNSGRALFTKKFLMFFLALGTNGFKVPPHVRDGLKLNSSLISHSSEQYMILCNIMKSSFLSVLT